MLRVELRCKPNVLMDSAVINMLRMADRRPTLGQHGTPLGLGANISGEIASNH